MSEQETATHLLVNCVSNTQPPGSSNELVSINTPAAPAPSFANKYRGATAEVKAVPPMILRK
ncbi:MAG: hypothetical protein ACNA8L_07155 [Luteolibacter sp.]